MRLLPFPALAAGLLCCSGLASAQTFSGIGPVRPLVLPPGEPSRPALEPPTSREAPRPASLRRPASASAPLRIWGETGEIVSTLYVTEAEARAGGRFQIGYLAAVSVLPEASSLTLDLNGERIGATAIDGAKGRRMVAFEIAPGVLSHGFNAVRIAAAQRHRVDCSVAATYELWTQIDAESTGFLTEAQPFADPADLAAAASAADGSTPIRLIQTGERLSERGVERLLGALQDVALAGRFVQPAADFAPEAENGEGIAVAAGPADQLNKALDLAASGPASGARLALLPGTAQRRPVLVATGGTEAEVADALAQLGRLRNAPAKGSTAGLRVLADAGGRRIEGGQSVTLAELGFPDATVTARTHRIAFDLALPHDLLAADYDRLVLDIDAGYAAGLAPGAQIAVEINGASAGNAPLARSRGESATRHTMFLPLRLLRPGRNRIAIMAELPREDDRACPSETAVAPARLTLLATTRLTIPPLARIARQPDLAETLSAGFPYVQGPRRPTLNVPAPDRDSMAAAATLAARLGLAAGRPIPFAFAAGRTVVSGPTLVVSAAPLLDASAVAAAGLDPQAVRDAWTGREALAARRDLTPSARRSALRRDAIAACRARPAPSSRTEASESAAPTESGPDLGGASVVLTQAVTGPADDDVMTLVTAPNAGSLREAVDCLVHPRVWNRPQGRMAVLSASDGTVTSRADDAPRYVATVAASPMNLRRIAAGWLSLHAGFYGFFALLVAGGLAGSTQLLVRNLGRRSK